jgi:hypothetical protein
MNIILGENKQLSRFTPASFYFEKNLIMLAHDRKRNEFIKLDKRAEKIRGRSDPVQRSTNIYIYIYIYIYEHPNKYEFINIHIYTNVKKKVIYICIYIYIYIYLYLYTHMNIRTSMNL